MDASLPGMCDDFASGKDDTAEATIVWVSPSLAESLVAVSVKWIPFVDECGPKHQS